MKNSFLYLESISCPNPIFIVNSTLSKNQQRSTEYVNETEILRCLPGRKQLSHHLALSVLLFLKGRLRRACKEACRMCTRSRRAEAGWPLGSLNLQLISPR